MRHRLSAGTALQAAGIVLAFSAGLASPARAQIARVRTASADAPKLLVVPFAREPNDSAMSVQVADAVRDRVRAAHLVRFNPILKDGMNRALVESGFPTDVPLEPMVARQLARFLNARLIIEGNIIPRGQDSVLIIARLVESQGAAPQSATASATSLRSRAGATGGDLANRLAVAHRSFEDVQQCRQHLDAQRYPQALAEANQALGRHPNSSAALLCMAMTMRAQNAGQDTIEAVLRRAVSVDSLNTTVMGQLASIYEQRGDTTRLIGMLRKILAIDYTDKRLRIRTAELLVRIGQQAGDTAVGRAYADSALELVNAALARSPADIELLMTKSIAMAVARQWDSAATTLEVVASADSQRVDSLFLFRMTNYLKVMQPPDSARLMRWMQIATVKMPNTASYWFDLSNLAMARGDTNTALEAGRRYIGLLPNDGRGHLLVARVFAARQQVDSSLAHAEVAARDSTLRSFTYGFFQQAGLLALRDTNMPRAESMLTRARDYAPNPQARVRPSYYLGLAQLQLAVKADSVAGAASRNDPTACPAVQRVRDLLPIIEQNIIAGVAENRQQANQILTQYIPAFRQRSDAMWRNYRCGNANGGGGGGAGPAGAPAGGSRPARRTAGGL